jgi:hypothetical protein
MLLLKLYITPVTKHVTKLFVFLYAAQPDMYPMSGFLYNIVNQDVSAAGLVPILTSVLFQCRLSAQYHVDLCMAVAM